jgi:hypothetical protein
VSLVGLGFAAFLAQPLSPPLRPLVPKLGLVNPVWEQIVPPAAVFLIIVLIFLGIGFVVHMKVAHHFKYATDDFTRIRWERLNQRLGLCVGLVGGVIYTLLLSTIIYVAGYPAVQLVTDESPAMERFLSSARKDLQSTGLDRTLSALDPMDEKYYLTSDLIGLLYNNPTVLDRLVNYPAFLALSERQEVKDLITDTDFLNLWQTKSPFLNLFNHPKVQGLINNGEVVTEVKQVDLKDLYRYLASGKSDKYDEEKILGRWRLDVATTFTQTRKKNPEMTAADMSRLKLLVTIFLPRLTFMATPDNKAFVRLELTDQARQMVEAARAAQAAAQRTAEEAGAAPPPQMDARMRQRYFPRGGGPGAPAPGTPTPPPTRATNAPLPGIPDVKFAGQGTWEREGTKYKLKITDEGGRTTSGEGSTTEDERLLMTLDGQPLVFVR